MNETVLSINTLPEHLFHRLHSDKVRVREEKNGFITLMPIVVDGTEETDDREALWEEVKGLYGIVRSDIDEKTELAEAREGKYGRLG